MKKTGVYKLHLKTILMNHKIQINKLDYIQTIFSNISLFISMHKAANNMDNNKQRVLKN